MAWITLSLRKQELKTESNELEMEIISKSREVRNIQRNLALQKAVVDADTSAQLHAIKEQYKTMKNQRPMQFQSGDLTHYFKSMAQYKEFRKERGQSANPGDLNKGDYGYIGSYKASDKEADTSAKEEYDGLYSNWKDIVYESAKEAYEEQKTYIQDIADDDKEDLEAEATEKQSQIEEEKTILESNLEDINQELQSVGDQIGTDIQSSTVKFK